MIDTHGKVVDGLFYYEAGWSDERIAKECPAPLAAVRYRRMNVFAPLPHTGGRVKMKYSDLDERIKALEAELDGVSRRKLDVLEKAINALLEHSLERNAVPREKLEQLQAYFNRGDNAAFVNGREPSAKVGAS